MKKKLFSLLLCLALILSVGVVAYDAAGGFTMTYLPGTSDTVTNMPAADSGVGGQAYTVSDKIPQREGYEFLGWRLDYEKEPTVLYTDYVVRYVDRTTKSDIADPITVNNQMVGATVTAEAPATIDNYDLDDDSVKTRTLQNGENEIIFYYKPAVANYTVRYVYINEDGEYEDIITPETGTGNVGSPVTKTRKSFAEYDYAAGTPRVIRKTLTRNDTDNEFIFIYEECV